MDEKDIAKMTAIIESVIKRYYAPAVIEEAARKAAHEALEMIDNVIQTRTEEAVRMYIANLMAGKVRMEVHATMVTDESD